MTRAHISKPILDAAGNVRTGARVRVLQPGTTTPITDSLFSAGVGAAALTNPFTATNGIVDFYLDTPQRVRIGITVGTEGETFFEDVDIAEPAAPDAAGGGAGFHKGAGNGDVIGGDLYGTADGYNPSTATGGDSMAIGSQAVANGSQAIAIGNNSTAEGPQAQAEGESATAHGNQAMAYGNTSIAGNTSLAVTDPKNNQPMAMGNSSDAEGNQAMAMGNTASSYGTQGVAVGNSASVTSQGGTAVGNSATAGSSYQKTHADDTSQATAIGSTALAQGTEDTVVGSAALTEPGGTKNTVVGTNSTARTGTNGSVNRSVVIGAEATVAVDDHGVIKVDEFEIVPSSPTGHATTLAVRDTADAKHSLGIDTTGLLLIDGAQYPPTTVTGADPETGATTTFVPAFSVQGIVSGALVVADHVLKPGLRVVKAGTAKVLVAHIDTPPTGSGAVIHFYRVNGGTSAPLGDVTIAAGQGAGSAQVSVACAKGDMIRFNVTAIGSTTPGADVNVSVDFA